MVRVAGRDAVVDDAAVHVELGVSVDVHEGVPLGCIQNMSDAQTLQAQHVSRHKPASGKRSRTKNDQQKIAKTNN